MTFYAVFLAAVNYSQGYQWSPRDGEMRLTEIIVYEFMAVHDVYRIGSCLSLGENADDPGRVLCV